MQLQEAIFNRRSVRRYTEQPVPEEAIQAIIKAGMWAPTACNEQHYRFLILKDKTFFENLVRQGTAGFIKNVHTAVLVLYRNTSQNREYMDHIQSGAACVQNMLLQAHELGIGACWVCNLPSQNRMRRLLGIPPFYSVISLVTLGYPVKTPAIVARRRNMEEVTRKERFDFDEHIALMDLLKIRLTAFLRFVYYRLPRFPWLIKMAEYFEKKFQN